MILVPALLIATLDANALYGMPLRDTLLRAAEKGLYRPTWSYEIWDEVLHHPASVLTEGNVPVEDTQAGRRAIVDDYVLTVENGYAILQVPEKGKVTVSLMPS